MIGGDNGQYLQIRWRTIHIFVFESYESYIYQIAPAQPSACPCKPDDSKYRPRARREALQTDPCSLFTLEVKLKIAARDNMGHIGRLFDQCLPRKQTLSSNFAIRQFSTEDKTPVQTQKFALRNRFFALQDTRVLKGVYQLHLLSVSRSYIQKMKNKLRLTVDEILTKTRPATALRNTFFPLFSEVPVSTVRACRHQARNLYIESGSLLYLKGIPKKSKRNRSYFKKYTKNSKGSDPELARFRSKSISPPVLAGPPSFLVS